MDTHKPDSVCVISRMVERGTMGDLTQALQLVKILITNGVEVVFLAHGFTPIIDEFYRRVSVLNTEELLSVIVYDEDKAMIKCSKYYNAQWVAQGAHLAGAFQSLFLRDTSNKLVLCCPIHKAAADHVT